MRKRKAEAKLKCTIRNLEWSQTSNGKIRTTLMVWGKKEEGIILLLENRNTVRKCAIG